MKLSNLNYSTRNQDDIVNLCLVFNTKTESYYFNFLLEYIKELRLNLKLNLINLYSIFNKFELTEQNFKLIQNTKILINIDESFNNKLIFNELDLIKDIFEIDKFLFCIFDSRNDRIFLIEITDENELQDDYLLRKIKEEKLEDLKLNDLKLNKKNLPILIYLFKESINYFSFYIEFSKNLTIFNFIKKNQESDFEKQNNIKKFTNYILGFLDVNFNFENKKEALKLKNKIKELTLYNSNKNTDLNKNEISINNDFLENTKFEIILQKNENDKIEISNFVNFVKNKVLNIENLKEIFLVKILNNKNNLEIYPNQLFWNKKYKEIRAIFYNTSNEKITFDKIQEIVINLSSFYKIHSIILI